MKKTLRQVVAGPTSMKRRPGLQPHAAQSRTRRLSPRLPRSIGFPASQSMRISTRDTIPQDGKKKQKAIPCPPMRKLGRPRKNKILVKEDS